MTQQLSERQRRDLRAIVMDGGFFSGMVGTGESYIPAFALAVGLGDVVSGLIATVPMLAGALLQLATPFAVARLGSYRRWVVGCACLQAASFVPLVIGGLRGDLSLGWVALATVGYWGFGMATGPAWNAWITSLVPEGLRARFFAHRTRVAQGSLVAALLGGGLLLELGRRLGHELLFFALIFAAALVLRLLSAGQLHRQSEEPGLPARHAAMTPAHAAPVFGQRGTRRMLAYLIAMMAATNVAAPFFTPYMLGPLGLSYGRFMALTAVAFVARLLVLPFLGRLIERRGPRFVLALGALAIIPV
ncbi:MAG: MFS transporter, partial [Myxococcales bacterium]|nr:MFS transporter [Myxococcales bacterium]